MTIYICNFSEIFFHCYHKLINLTNISNNLTRNQESLFEWKFLFPFKIMLSFPGGWMIEPLPPANHWSIHSRILLFIKIHLEWIVCIYWSKNIIWSMISSHLVIPCLLFYILWSISCMWIVHFVQLGGFQMKTKIIKFNPETQAFLTSTMPSICLSYLNIFNCVI